jgi:crossover junction endodeoxyribonuclease RuvC
MAKDHYKILGVDPGTQVLGYAVIEIIKKEVKVVDMGEIHLTKYESHQEKLKEIFLQLQEVIETYLPRELAVESPFYGKNVQSMLKLGRAQGVAMAAGMTMGLNIVEYSPKSIKQSITGNGNASKEQVASMLQSMLKYKWDSKLLDATDALGAAVTHFHQQKFGISLKGKSSNWSSFLKNNPERII